MANIRRLATFTPEINATDGLIIELTDDTQVKITQAAIELATEGQLETTLRTTLTRDDVHVHKNRDGTVALAIGQEPATWPEDET